MVGTHSGEVKVFNINDSSEEFTQQCHESYINYIKSSRDEKMVLTTTSWRAPLSVLWSVSDKEFKKKLAFEDEEYVEFSNVIQDKVLGTKGESAIIYDLTTGKKIQKLTPTNYNQYNKNRATFCPNDELILSGKLLFFIIKKHVLI